jgi:hypothetical protein
MAPVIGYGADWLHLAGRGISNAAGSANAAPEVKGLGVDVEKHSFPPPLSSWNRHLLWQAVKRFWKSITAVNASCSKLGWLSLATTWPITRG